MADENPDFERILVADDPGFEEIMNCIFGIRPHETRTYFVLFESPGSTVAELADDLDRDRSNVNRSLTTLHEKGLVDRERRLLDSGGHVYQYYPIPLPETKQRMRQSIDAWTEQVHEQIDDFDPG